MYLHIEGVIVKKQLPKPEADLIEQRFRGIQGVGIFQEIIVIPGKVQQDSTVRFFPGIPIHYPRFTVFWKEVDEETHLFFNYRGQEIPKNPGEKHQQRSCRLRSGIHVKAQDNGHVRVSLIRLPTIEDQVCLVETVLFDDLLPLDLFDEPSHIEKIRHAAELTVPKAYRGFVISAFHRLEEYKRSFRA